MARHVKISTIGAASPCSAPDVASQQLFEKMTSFWDAKLAVVWPDCPDLVVLPETCDRFANFQPKQILEFARMWGDDLLEFFREQARRHRCYLAYPTMRLLDDGTRLNSMLMIGRSGEIVGAYDKNHVVIYETTDLGIISGNKAPLFECDFGTVAGAICFDLNFEELRLQYQAARPDVIVFSSMYHGGLMQPYWAYSCRAHFVGCVSAPACPSAILSPVGHELATTTNYFDTVTATVNLDCCVAYLGWNWEKLSALKEKYGPQVSIYDPGRLGAVLISSETHERTVQEMVAEFEIELIDDYMARSLAHHAAYRVSSDMPVLV